jgi:hypothetical protein
MNMVISQLCVINSQRSKGHTQFLLRMAEYAALGGGTCYHRREIFGELETRSFPCCTWDVRGLSYLPSMFQMWNFSSFDHFHYHGHGSFVDVII